MHARGLADDIAAFVAGRRSRIAPFLSLYAGIMSGLIALGAVALVREGSAGSPIGRVGEIAGFCVASLAALAVPYAGAKIFGFVRIEPHNRSEARIWGPETIRWVVIGLVGAVAGAAATVLGTALIGK